VVIDSDKNWMATQSSLRNALKSLGFTAPQMCLTPDGVNPKVTYMLLPAAETNGMLEDLCLNALQSDPPLLSSKR
jgi:hypothetical protein